MAQPSNIINAKVNKLKQVLATLPLKVGDTAILFVKQRFREQAWADNSTEVWKPRNIGGKRNKGRAILTNTGRLRRGWRIARVTADSITIANDVPYAKTHNDGYRGVVQVKQHVRNRWKKSRVETGKLTKKGKQSMKTITTAVGEYEVKNHSRKMNMPRRRMIGKSAILDNQIKRLISAEIMKAFR